MNTMTPRWTLCHWVGVGRGVKYLDVLRAGTVAGFICWWEVQSATLTGLHCVRPSSAQVRRHEDVSPAICWAAQGIWWSHFHFIAVPYSYFPRSQEILASHIHADPDKNAIIPRSRIDATMLYGNQLDIAFAVWSEAVENKVTATRTTSWFLTSQNKCY